MQVALNTFYVSLWIFLSGAVIIYNKWILAVYGFSYPITLTMWHMGFSSILAFALASPSYPLHAFSGTILFFDRAAHENAISVRAVAQNSVVMSSLHKDKLSLVMN